MPPTKVKGDTAEVLWLRHFTDLYGFRATASENASVYYFNAWEFATLWEVRRLPPPTSSKEAPSLTVPDPAAVEGSFDAYFLNEGAVEYYLDSKDILFYPETPGAVNLRQIWYMVRRRRPMVPAPAITPMPDKYAEGEKKAQLYSVYLRPWVLVRGWATDMVVPHITDLDAVQRQETAKPWRLRGKQPVPEGQVQRCYAQAWHTYICGHVVSRRASKAIVQFMAACCGKSEKEEDPEEKKKKDCL